MADGGERLALRYSAFISYNRRDAAFARRLHRRLEAYRLPRDVARAVGAAGLFARRLRPIFRDRDELTAAEDLTCAVQEAIAQSSAMIVVCSPEAAASDWVGREVAAFRRAHGHAAILAALIDGDEHSAFPEALCQPGADGRAMQPLAADFRREGDGERLALLKLVAVLAGVRLDALVQRDSQRRVRQVAVAAGAALAGMAVMSVLTFVAVDARNAAEAERNRGEGLIGFMLTDLRGKLKGVGRLDLLDAVNQGALGYYQGQDLTRMPESALQQRAQLLQAVGEDDEKRGRFEDARSHFEEASRTTAALLRSEPQDERRIFAHAQSAYWVGEVNWRTGKPSDAEAAFQLYATLANQLVSKAPKKADWLMEVAEANIDLGEVILRHERDYGRAESLLRFALAELADAAATRGSDLEIKGLTAVVYGFLGDIKRLRGDCDGALGERSSERKILTEISAANLNDAETQRDEVANSLAVARIYLACGSVGRALVLIDEAKTLATALAERDRENVDSERQVRILALFEAAALMTSSASPAASNKVALLLGDCKQDLQLPNNLEQFDFCTILQARRLSSIGKRSEAAQLLSLPEMIRLRSRTDLTARWGLDFAKEIELAHVS